MISFANTFLSYLMLFVVIAVVAGCAVAIGITLRRKKNNKAAEIEAASGNE